MPWRKYRATEREYGKSYKICKGVQVRCDARKKWTIFVTAKGQRSNTTVGEGRDNFIKAIKAAEVVAKKLENLPQDFGQKKPEESVVMFREYSKEWLNGNKGRWSEDTYEKYEITLRLHLYPFPEFNAPLNKISRKTIKKRLRDHLQTHSPSSVATTYNVLSGIFNEAIDDKLIHSNPASGLLKSILPPVNKRNLTQADHTWPFSQKRIRQTMIRVCKTAGLRVRHPHDLRHTYATILLMAHTSPAYIQRQLGHSNIQTTINIYGHWIPGEGRDGLEDALTKSGEKMHKNTYKTRHTTQPTGIVNL
ncbi:MAG: site-specific integrase [Desulfobacteraceae bacterium]|nr:site-specific integrase [Desulfobacteraceae bacterium]